MYLSLWTAPQAFEDGAYFKDADSWPAILQQLKQQALASSNSADAAEPDAARDGASAASVARAALGAMGLMLEFLQNGMLDRAVVPMGRFEPLEGAQVRTHWAQYVHDCTGLLLLWVLMWAWFEARSFREALHVQQRLIVSSKNLNCLYNAVGCQLAAAHHSLVLFTMQKT